MFLAAQSHLPTILVKNSKVVCTSCNKRGSLIVFGQIGDQKCSSCWLEEATNDIVRKTKFEYELSQVLESLSDLSTVEPYLPKIFEVGIYSGTFPTCYFCHLSKETMVTLQKKVTQILQDSQFTKLNYVSLGTWGHTGNWSGSWGSPTVGIYSPPTITTASTTSNTTSGYYIPMSVTTWSGGANASNWSSGTFSVSGTMTGTKDASPPNPMCFCVSCARKFTSILKKQIKAFIKVQKKEIARFNKMISKIKNDTGSLAELLEESAK